MSRNLMGCIVSFCSFLSTDMSKAVPLFAVQWIIMKKGVKNLTIRNFHYVKGRVWRYYIVSEPQPLIIYVMAKETNNTEVEAHMRNWLTTQPRSFLEEGIYNLLKTLGKMYRTWRRHEKKLSFTCIFLIKSLVYIWHPLVEL